MQEPAQKQSTARPAMTSWWRSTAHSEQQYIITLFICERRGQAQGPRSVPCHRFLAPTWSSINITPRLGCLRGLAFAIQTELQSPLCGTEIPDIWTTDHVWDGALGPPGGVGQVIAPGSRRIRSSAHTCHASDEEKITAPATASSL